jgi:hypothetical protein
MRLNTYITYKQSYEEDKQVDLLMRAKNTNIINLFCYDEDDLVVDITGATVTFIVKEKPSDDDDDAVIDIEVTSLTNPASGNTEIEIDADDCEELEGNYLYEIKIELEDGKIYELAYGNICFQRSLSGI